MRVYSAGIPLVVGVICLQFHGEHAELAKGDIVVRVPLAALPRAVQHLKDLTLARVQLDVVEQGLDLVVGNGRHGTHPRVPCFVQLPRRFPVQNYSLGHICRQFVLFTSRLLYIL